jgi:hypothetical protein
MVALIIIIIYQQNKLKQYARTPSIHTARIGDSSKESRKQMHPH